MLEDRPDDQAAAQAAAVERARWLAELAHEIEQAQRLARRLAKAQPDGGEALVLHEQLEAVRREVDEIRRGTRLLLRRENDPKWMGLVPWDRRRPD